MGGRGSASSGSSMRDRARNEIERMEKEIKELEGRQGTVTGKGINTFISSSVREMERTRRVRSIRNAIASLRETFDL